MQDNYLSKILVLKKKKEMQEHSFVEQLINSVESRINILRKNGINELYYDVPNIVPGLPLYNSIEVAKILHKILLEKGYNCVYMYENKIYMSWKGIEKKYHHVPILIQRIKNRITAHLLKNGTVFEIPDFMAGFPLYDRQETAVIIKNYFDKQGFVVTKVNSVLHISWDLDEIERMHNMEIKFQSNKEKLKSRKDKIHDIRMKNCNVFGNPDKLNKAPNKVEIPDNVEIPDKVEIPEKVEIPNDRLSHILQNKKIPQPHNNVSMCTLPTGEFTSIDNLNSNETDKSVPIRLKHSKAYRNNTRTIIPIEYTDIPIKSKVSFVNKRKSNKPGPYKSVRSNIESLEKDLEQLKLHVRDSKK